jgi:hypothetical protein
MSVSNEYYLSDQYLKDSIEKQNELEEYYDYLYETMKINLFHFEVKKTTKLKKKKSSKKKQKKRISVEEQIHTKLEQMDLKQVIRLPNEIIRNGSIKHNDFVVCFWLKYFLWQQQTNNLTINHVELKKKCGFSDNRQLKKSLINLHYHGIIKTEIDEEFQFPIHSNMNIEVNEDKLSSENKFTQLPFHLIDFINEIKPIGFRLLFYFESFINRNQLNKQYAYPPMKKIREDLKLSFDSIEKYNELLRKHKLIIIYRQDPKHESDEDNREVFWRFNNRYFVNLPNSKNT